MPGAVTAREQLARWAHHNQATAAALGVIFALVVVVAIGATFAALRFRHLATAAEQAQERGRRPPGCRDQPQRRVRGIRTGSR